MAHLNDGEFVGPWGVRSMSIKDRLFDYNDHDWAGPMSYAGDGPQLAADLYTAGFPRQAEAALARILWWPEYMAVYPQGIANDDYSFRYPEARAFGGRITGGRSNVIAGCTGVETILRGMFGVAPDPDGSLGFAHTHRPGDAPYTLSYPLPRPRVDPHPGRPRAARAGGFAGRARGAALGFRPRRRCRRAHPRGRQRAGRRRRPRGHRSRRCAPRARSAGLRASALPGGRPAGRAAVHRRVERRLAGRSLALEISAAKD